MEFKKGRNPHFSDDENVYLVERVLQDKELLFEKCFKPNISTLKAKKWAEITAGLKVIRPQVTRDIIEVKKKWKNIYSDARRYVAETKRPQTGGGPPPRKPPTHIMMVVDSEEFSGAANFEGIGGYESGTSASPNLATHIGEMEKTSASLDQEGDINDTSTISVERGEILKKRRARDDIESLHAEVLRLEKKKLSTEIEKLSSENEVLKRKKELYELKIEKLQLELYLIRQNSRTDDIIIDDSINYADV